MTNIGILDYKTCNAYSIFSSIENLGYSVKLINNVDDFKFCDKLIIPGVGSAKKSLEYLRKNKLDKEIIKFFNEGKPLLGICLGAQIFCKNLYEGGFSIGLGIIDYDVVEINKFYQNIQLNIGWFEITNNEINDLNNFNQINKKYFYFCHQYFMKSNKSPEKENINYKNFEIPAIIKKNNLVACQFHPEKSQENGEKLLLDFLEL